MATASYRVHALRLGTIRADKSGTVYGYPRGTVLDVPVWAAAIEGATSAAATPAERTFRAVRRNSDSVIDFLPLTRFPGFLFVEETRRIVVLPRFDPSDAKCVEQDCQQSR